MSKTRACTLCVRGCASVQAYLCRQATVPTPGEQAIERIHQPKRQRRGIGVSGVLGSIERRAKAARDSEEQLLFLAALAGHGFECEAEVLQCGGRGGHCG